MLNQLKSDSAITESPEPPFTQTRHQVTRQDEKKHILCKCVFEVFQPIVEIWILLILETLQDSLGGDSKTMMIVQCSPAGEPRIPKISGWIQKYLEILLNCHHQSTDQLKP